MSLLAHPGNKHLVNVLECDILLASHLAICVLVHNGLLLAPLLLVKVRMQDITALATLVGAPVRDVLHAPARA